MTKMNGWQQGLAYSRQATLNKHGDSREWSWTKRPIIQYVKILDHKAQIHLQDHLNIGWNVSQLCVTVRGACLGLMSDIFQSLYVFVFIFYILSVSVGQVARVFVCCHWCGSAGAVSIYSLWFYSVSLRVLVMPHFQMYYTRCTHKFVSICRWK